MILMHWMDSSSTMARCDAFSVAWNEKTTDEFSCSQPKTAYNSGELNVFGTHIVSPVLKKRFPAPK